MSYSIIIPIKDEAKSIPKLLIELKEFSRDNEIIFINDGSTDKSEELLLKSSYIKLISFKKNRGKGFAIISALNTVKNKKVIITDGDLELKTNELKKLMLLNTRSNIYFIIGSRFKEIKPFKSIWDFGNYFLTTIFNFKHNSNLSDALCCAKSFFIDDINLKSIKSESFDIDIEITSKLLNAQKKKYLVVPLEYQRREVHEGKKIRIIDGWKILFRIFYN